MPQAQEQLFVVTASNPDAKRHIEVSVAHWIEPVVCEAHFEATVLDEVRQKSADGHFYAWGARPGDGNERNWNALQTGDHVLVYQDGIYTYWTRVIAKHRNEGFAEAIWKRHSDGDTWEYMYFLQPPVSIR